MIDDFDELSEPELTVGEKQVHSRRSVLQGFGAAGVAATLPPAMAAEARETTTRAPAASARDRVGVTLKVNGRKQDVQIDPRASLLDTLRETLHLTGTKKGCDHGQCGACTVHLDGKRALSCLSLALACQGHEITTIEGLGTPEKLHPMQEAFVACDGFQCGYCTAGQIMSAVALHHEQIGPEDADVKEAMSGNICRCGAYSNIVDAIQQARKAGGR
jgi:xanthine dehydrogenase YagT iron-sulfur-binding subunit